MASPDITVEQARMTAHDEVVQSLEPFVAKKLNLLIPVGKIWQPSELLPDMEDPDWHDKVEDFRKHAARLSDALVVLVTGNAITEEGLPLFTPWLNRIRPIRDKTGTDQNAWARWNRGWGAEEHRHEVVLDRWLYLSRRVDMKQVERTVQYYLNNGFDTHAGLDSYKALLFPTFQEEATELSHKNVGIKARKQGDSYLAEICRRVGGDESRHGEFYIAVWGEIFNQDPEGAMIEFYNMMRTGIVMPAALMSDKELLQPGVGQSDLFKAFSLVAQAEGIYTAYDYANIFGSLLDRWHVRNRTVSGEAAEAQDKVVKLYEKHVRTADRVMESVYRHRHAPFRFSWIYNRQVPLTKPA